MPSTVHAPRAGEITFELERFELDGDRLELTGRWFGVRGRRFMRPTLTRVGGRERSRVLAELEHKPWPAEDGELWEAAFPWSDDVAAGEFELSVAPDIMIELPSPSSRRGRPRRLSALARRPTVTSGPARSEDDPEDLEHARARPASDLDLLRARFARRGDELEAARTEREEARTALSQREDQLAAAEAEVSAMMAARDAALRELAEAQAAAEALRAQRDERGAERDEVRAERNRLLAERQQLLAERERLRSERDEHNILQDRLRAERDRLAGERERMGKQLAQMVAEREQALAELRSQLARAQNALEDANQQRDEAVNARGAAIVMRRAARTPPNYEPPSTWWRQALAVIALIAVVFAILIVAQVL